MSCDHGYCRDECYAKIDSCLICKAKRDIGTRPEMELERCTGRSDIDQENYENNIMADTEKNITQWDADKIKNDPEEQKKFIEWAEKQPKESTFVGKTVVGIDNICPHPSQYVHYINIMTVDLNICDLCGCEV